MRRFSATWSRVYDRDSLACWRSAFPAAILSYSDWIADVTLEAWVSS